MSGRNAQAVRVNIEMKQPSKTKMVVLLLLACSATLQAHSNTKTAKSSNQRQQPKRATRRDDSAPPVEDTETRIQEQLAREAKIKLEDARETALKRVPGGC